MKPIYLLTAILLASSLSFGFGGFKVPDSVKVEPQQPVVTQPPAQPAVQKPLAWGPDKSEWDKALREAISEANLPLTTEIPCIKTPLNECFAQLVSIMAKYESGWKTDVKYEESFSDANGKVISRGLLQISHLSANQSAYKCNITDAKQLHDPLINLKCGVKIIAYQAKKSGKLIGEPKKGCAAYWSVCRKSSGSYAKIMAYMDKF